MINPRSGSIYNATTRLKEGRRGQADFRHLMFLALPCTCPRCLFIERARLQQLVSPLFTEVGSIIVTIQSMTCL